jgi:hypothetical protein
VLGDVDQITETARDTSLGPDDELAVAAVDEMDRPRALFEEPTGPRPRHLRAADLRAADG